LDALQQIAQQIRQQRASNAPLVAPARAPDKTPTIRRSIAVAPAKEPGGVAAPAPARSDRSNHLAEHDKASLADLGHELRTPLGSISGFADMMITERFGPLGHEKYAGYVRDIQASAGHVLSLIEKFTAREHQGVVPDLSFSDVDVNQIADECLSAMRPLAEQAGVRLAGALAARLPRVIADRRSLKQIFLNLLSNAIRFTASGGTATLTTSYQPGGPYCIEIRDTGIGMSPELIASVTGDGVACSGLPVGRGRQGRGLALTSRLITANGARLAIESTSGEGTAVQIIVPLDRLVLV
jgi:signal transduction histidine kinase